MLSPMMLVCLILFPFGSVQDSFTSTERDRILSFWNEPGRYRVGGLQDVLTKGPFRVRLTPEASIWFLGYQKALGAVNAPPTVDAKPRADSVNMTTWETWIAQKLAADRFAAQVAADEANAAVLGSNYRRVGTESPPAAGTIPSDLVRAAGHPPPLASAVAPLSYSIRFPSGESYVYSDWADMRPRYGYFRRSNGVVSYGTPVSMESETTLRALFEASGFTTFEKNVMLAVSRLEGGFDSINTYDTGYVSVGFVQFITGSDAKHSLSDVLLTEKRDNPKSFDDDFHNLGVDVRPDKSICIVHPATGAELSGNDAVMAIIEDKRLTAIFQRAGKNSAAFRIAQIKTAKSNYWPMDDTFAVQIDGQTLKGKTSDIVTSEAGAATLFDRKINRGNIGPFGDAVRKVMVARGLKKLSEVGPYERDIIDLLKYRTNYLLDLSLTQPPK